jgi:FtsH-binding integral membrane protein
MSAYIASAPSSQHGALRALLLFLTIVILIAGLALLFATGSLSALIGAPAGSAGVMIDFLIKALGAICLGMSYIAYCAWRDPVRYIGVIDAMIVTLVFVVLLELYVLVTGRAGVFPDHVILWSLIVRAILLVALIALRPRGPAIPA